MERIFLLIVIAMADKLIQGNAINSGFSLKHNPIFVKEDASQQSGALFAKIPQETPNNAHRREFLTKAFFPYSSELSVGCTNQIAKIVFPQKLSEMNTTTETFDNFINIPIIPQPFSDYKIIVATAPWNMKISGENAKPAVVYIVFPEDDEDSNKINIPAIYFVKNKGRLLDPSKKDKIDPVIVIDSNRTVTGLKSKEVAKFIKFKNKFLSRNSYDVTR